MVKIIFKNPMLNKRVMQKDIILHGDVYSSLNFLDNNSVAVAVTSPPYWKQRDYEFKGQIGQENTPEEYIGRLLTIFNVLKEKLREDGVFFLNIGDKYLERYSNSHLLQIPYRLAYHMVKDGWRLEDIIIWYKPNHLPSSVKNRFTNTYEPILVFTKNEKNIYHKKTPKVVEIASQQLPWKHTAIYPERLVLEMLYRVVLNDEDIILDPFAGTGTTAVAASKLRNSLHSKKVYSVMIEKKDEFIDIIKQRTNIKDIVKINEIDYEWKPVEDYDFPQNIEPKIITNEKFGEVYIAENSNEFLSILRGISSEEFKKFHREDAPYFFGVKDWDLTSIYYPYLVYKQGYILRNMLIVTTDDGRWYPVFMIVKNTKNVSYRFYLDHVRVKPKTNRKRRWQENDFIGMKIRDISGKEKKEGFVVKIIDKYEDEFPKMVIVKWDNGKISTEFVIHPLKEELYTEGIKFFCPKCNFELTYPYDPLEENFCPHCGTRLWTDINNVPIIIEPQEVVEIVKKIKENKNNYLDNDLPDINQLKGKKNTTTSKFLSLNKINWGASPGARRSVIGEYFTKTRLYKIDQSLVAQYLNLFIRSQNVSMGEIERLFPKKYHHVVRHWFRKDLNGSIPVPEDIELILKVFNIDNEFLKVLGRTTLKFQTVKTSSKGKNPGDLIKNNSGEKELIQYFRKLYIP